MFRTNCFYCLQLQYNAIIHNYIREIISDLATFKINFNMSLSLTLKPSSFQFLK